MVAGDQLGDARRLGHRPRRAADGPVAPRRRSGPTPTSGPPTDYDADHVLLRTVRCVNGEVQVAARLRRRRSTTAAPGASGATPATATTQARAQRWHRRSRAALTTDMRIGFEGPRATTRTLLKEGDTRFCALSWSEQPGPTTYEEAYDRLVWTAHHWQHWLARGTLPRPPVAPPPGAQRADLKGLTYAPTGALIAAGDDLAAGDAGRRAQLGLPLQLDPGLDPGAVGAWTRSASTGRRTTSSPSSPTWPSAADELQIMYGIGGEQDLTERLLEHLQRVRRRACRYGSATARSTSSSTTSGARCWTRCAIHTTLARQHRRAAVADPVQVRSSRPSSTGASPTGGSGRSGASRSTSPPPR